MLAQRLGLTRAIILHVDDLGGSHGANMEKPEEFNRAVLDFLAEHAETERGAAA